MEIPATPANQLQARTGISYFLCGKVFVMLELINIVTVWVSGLCF